MKDVSGRVDKIGCSVGRFPVVGPKHTASASTRNKGGGEAGGGTPDGEGGSGSGEGGSNK